MTRLTKHGELDEDYVCPHCGEDVEPRWVACPHCGRKLGRNLCPSCRKPVQPEWAACPACGARLSRQHASAGEPSSVTEEDAFEWLVHDNQGPSMDSDDAVDAAESIATALSTDQFLLLKTAR